MPFEINPQAALQDRARAAAYYTPGETLSSLIEHALKREIERMELERGSKVPPLGSLKTGRPMTKA